MALSFLNRCVWRATAGGTGPYTVASAITGYYTPEQCTNPSVVDGDVYRAFAESDDRTEHQEGYGTYDAGTDTFTFTTILSSTNSGNAVNFSAAPKVHMGGPLAQEMHYDIIYDSGAISNDPSIDFDFDPTVYSRIEVFAELTIGTAATPPTQINLIRSPGTGSESILAIDNGFLYFSNGGVASGSYELTTNTAGNRSLIQYAFTGPDGDNINRSSSSPDDLTNGGVIEFSITATDDSGAGAAVNFASGRVFVIGTRRP